MSRLIVIEDNVSLAIGLKENLEFEGHEVAIAHGAAEGLALARGVGVDLVILDIMLPDGDGFHVLKVLREAGHDVPVLILSALGEETDRVRGLRYGADDYLTKPFGLMELLARVHAILRRTGGREPPPAARWEFGPIVIDEATQRVTRHGREVNLRPKEYALLMALVRRRGALASRVDLLREVWGYSENVRSRTVDTHMAELRRKLEPDAANPVHLLTVLKSGYRWEPSRA